MESPVPGVHTLDKELSPACLYGEAAADAFILQRETWAQRLSTIVELPTYCPEYREYLRSLIQLPVRIYLLDSWNLLLLFKYTVRQINC